MRFFLALHACNGSITRNITCGCQASTLILPDQRVCLWLSLRWCNPLDSQECTGLQQGRLPQGREYLLDRAAK